MFNHLHPKMKEILCLDTRGPTFVVLGKQLKLILTVKSYLCCDYTATLDTFKQLLTNELCYMEC